MPNSHRMGIFLLLAIPPQDRRHDPDTALIAFHPTLTVEPTTDRFQFALVSSAPRPVGTAI